MKIFKNIKYILLSLIQLILVIFILFKIFIENINFDLYINCNEVDNLNYVNDINDIKINNNLCAFINLNDFDQIKIIIDIFKYENINFCEPNVINKNILYVSYYNNNLYNKIIEINITDFEYIHFTYIFMSLNLIKNNKQNHCILNKDNFTCFDILSSNQIKITDYINEIFHYYKYYTYCNLKYYVKNICPINSTSILNSYNSLKYRLKKINFNINNCITIDYNIFNCFIKE